MVTNWLLILAKNESYYHLRINPSMANKTKFDQKIRTKINRNLGNNKYFWTLVLSNIHNIPNLVDSTGQSLSDPCSKANILQTQPLMIQVKSLLRQITSIVLWKRSHSETLRKKIIRKTLISISHLRSWWNHSIGFENVNSVLIWLTSICIFSQGFSCNQFPANITKAFDNVWAQSFNFNLI